MPNDPREKIRWAEQAAELRNKLLEVGLIPPYKNEDESFDAYHRRLDGLSQFETVSFVRPPSPFWRRVTKIAYNAIAEGVNTLFLILLLAGARWLVEHLFGESKFFDSVPIRYLFDVGDIAIIGRFVWNTLKGEE